MFKKLSSIGGMIAAIVMLLTLAPSLVSAQTATGQYTGRSRGTYTPPAATGTVAAISSNSITLTGANGTTYTVDTTNATISKLANNARTTIKVADIAGGDTLTVYGIASGTNIAATRITDGVVPTKTGTGTPKSFTPPVASGAVASINGNSITLTGENGITYTIDATNATISKIVNNARTTIQVADIATNDSLVVFGTASGTNIAATRIMDGAMPTSTGRGNRMNPAGTAVQPQKTTTTGTVASISGTSISINGANSTAYTVDVGKAKFRRKANAAMLITDIQTGDTVKVTGMVSGANIVAAIVQDTSMGTLRDHTTGTIAAVNGTTFTVTTKANATLTVNTTSTTVIEKFIGNSKQAATLSDLAVGENMLITGAVDTANNTIAASIVRIEMTRATLNGTVQSVSGNTINFTDKKGQSFSFDAAGAKLMRRFGAAIVDPSSLQNGDMLSVMGLMNGNAGFTAQSVRDNSLQARNGTFTGSVTAVNGASFTLQSKNRGVQTINTTSTTVFKQGKTTVTLATVAVGQTVIVVGIWDRTSSNVTAARVTIKQ